MFKKLQKIGQAFMLPIALLPAAGLLLGIGGSLSNEATLAAHPALNIAFLQNIFKIMNAAGNIVFSNLSLLLCVGLCIGLAKKDKGVAALAGIVGFLVMNATTSEMLTLFNPKGSSIDTGVVGALVMGAIAVTLHNRYENIELPQVLGFFGGPRFVPIVTSFAAIFVGAAFFIVWPPLQNLLTMAGKGIAGAGVFGTFLYGFLLRLTGAVGLHHMIISMFWYTELGGREVVAGKTVVGAQKIYFAQLADPAHTGLYTHATRFFAGRFSTMIFGLPAAALAMYHCVKKEKRKKYAGLFAGVALTSMITGITEPLEYMFLFVSPALYVLHAFYDGLSFMIADLLKIRIGNTFSGGFIDFFLFGILQGNARTNWIREIPFGLCWSVLYYFSFKFAILKFNIMTPGRADSEESDTTDTILSSANNLTIASAIVDALGGRDNIEDMEACITRLRVSVKDPAKVDKDALMKLGATGVLEIEGGVQAIFGTKAVVYKNAIDDLFNSPALTH